MEGTEEIAVHPEIQTLDTVLDSIKKGELRIPKFQRPFVWRPEQMTTLFDSIEKGYPIGSLLVWQTTESIPSLGAVGGIDVAPAEPGQMVSYVLDGQQRLSTLFGCLRRPADAPHSAHQSDWMWWVYRELGRVREGNRYRHWRRSDQPVPPSYLPLRSIPRTMDFLAYARAVQKALPEQADELVEEAERVAQRVKGYKLPVVRLVGGSLGQAVEVFSRINSSGQKMTPEQMVSALTYSNSGEESLADRVEEIQERIAAEGFGEIPTTTIFQTVLGVAGEEEVQQTRWELLAQRLEPYLDQAVKDADGALARAVAFLREQVPVPLARLVPYNLQIMLLGVFFHHRPEPNPEQVGSLIRWFWATSWAGSFAGATSTQVRTQIKDMKAFALGEGELDVDELTARSFPDSFDFRSARARIFILWELRRFPERIDLHGDPVDPVISLSRSHTDTYRHVATRPGTEGRSSPGNRLIMTSQPGVSLRNALAQHTGPTEEILNSHGIPQKAFDRLVAGDDEGFIRLRAEYLASLEQEFMDEVGVQHAGSLVGETDIDTE
ncbi:DUF262 domain-containing protein [Nocardiopsis sp. NPDC058631]|uniref:DUF262 domain-containing protein n=1 Tax=Nocardiopsis sp. NPDC058631 TaxID=3346566 RepID=UPI0036622CB8